MKYALLGFCMLLLLIPACNNLDTPEVKGMNTNTGEQKDWNRSLFGPGPVNYGVVDRMDEPFDPVNEANNTGSSYRSPATPRQDHGEDQTMIENIIYEMPGVSPGLVILTGGRAQVNITFNDDGISPEQEEAKIRELEAMLYNANPRYNYKVTRNAIFD